MSSQTVVKHLDPALWGDHRFGLSETRWGRLKDGAFWITGAGSGYGRAIAVALAAAGARTFITGRRIKKLEETRSEAIDFGINVELCHPVVADITSEGELANAIQLITKHTGSLSGLVNCAALPQPETEIFPLSELRLENWVNLIKTNLTAQWLTTKAALPLLVSGSNEARILFFTSEAAWADTTGFGPYNICKAAVNSLGVSFASECKVKFPEKDVQVNILDPGEAKSEMNQKSNISPYEVVNVVLKLLSHPENGPNGHFFHRDGRYLEFGYSEKYLKSLNE